MALWFSFSFNWQSSSKRTETYERDFLRALEVTCLETQFWGGSREPHAQGWANLDPKYLDKDGRFIPQPWSLGLPYELTNYTTNGCQVASLRRTRHRMVSDTVFKCKPSTKPLAQHRDSVKSLPLNSALAVAGSVTLLRRCWGFFICHIASRKPNEKPLVVIRTLTIGAFWYTTFTLFSGDSSVNVLQILKYLGESLAFMSLLALCLHF